MSEITIQELAIELTLAKDANNVVSIVETPTNKVSVSKVETSLTVVQPSINTINIEEPTPNQVIISNQTVIQAPSAESAAKLILTSICNEDITAWSMVRLISSTHVGLTDNSTYEESLAIGIAIESKLTGEDIRILTFGIAEDASFVFTLNDPLFLDVLGAITDIPPVASGKFVTQIAQSLGTGAIFISVKTPVEIL